MAQPLNQSTDFAFIAVLKKRGKIYQAEAALGDERSVFVGRKHLNGARSGELVVIQTGGRGRGGVTRRLGQADSIPAIMEGIFEYYRIPRGFSGKALAEADQATRLAEKEDEGRHDLTPMMTVTIDPDEAQDFDDAVSLEDGPRPGEITLFVHIADVSYYVESASVLEREASAKACSVYLPVDVEPMLPRVLSNDVCSLRPGLDRKCVTVEMVYPAPGDDRDTEREQKGHHEELVPKRVRFYRSLIRSRRRLTYNEVDDYFQGEAQLDEKVAALLERCRKLSSALRSARFSRGALAIETFEPEFRLDDDEVVDVRPRPESESHALIEEFMIAANEAVADFLERRKCDCIYRVHEYPDPADVDALFERMEDLGVATPPFSLESGTAGKAGEAVRRFVRSLPGVLSVEERSRSFYGEAILRSLKQARYLEDNLGHYGLASSAYLHFTSPIRRYPDLVVHRSLLNELNLADWKTSRLELAEAAQASSEKERRAAMVEHAGDDTVLAFLLDRRLYEKGWDSRFDGEIISLIPSGLFLRFDCCFEGFVPARNLRGDYYRLNDKGSALVGRRSGRPFRLGDHMKVRVRRIDKLRGKIELEPAR